MRSFVAASLEEEGDVEVVAAGNGFQALALLPTGHFDLVITDVNMPDINGLELIRFLRASPTHRTTPVVIISTEGRERDRDRALGLGADAYLTKPFAPEALVALVRKHLPALS